MSKSTSQKSNRRTGRTKSKRRTRTSSYVVLLPLALVAAIAGIWMFSRLTPADRVTPADITAEIIPQASEQTSYGLALALDNTPRFIDYYNGASLTPSQRATMQKALQPLKAPCCDDNSMATCCCPCNLAKSVWGLSSYLIVEKGYNAAQVRESALQWLRFIHSDYYVLRELENRGIDPGIYGLSYEAPCYNGLCELPFVEGGCGGMEALQM